MATTIRCTGAKRTLDLVFGQPCDFVAGAETWDEALAEKIMGSLLGRGLATRA